MEKQEVNDLLKKVEEKWKGKKVYIIGDHPHAGEKGEVVEAKMLVGKCALEVKGEWDSFFVFDVHNLHLLPK